MNMQEIRALARERGITPGRTTKVALIRTIQQQEGNFDCFATARDGICDQEHCLWRGDCFREAGKAPAS